MESENATGIGAGILAGMVEGVFQTTEEAIERYVKKGKLYIPDQTKKAGYDEAYRRYLKCQEVCQELF